MQLNGNSKVKGVALIEAMVAIVVLSLGILGILGVQMRTLGDNQSSVRRAQAMRLIEDLSERAKLNPNAVFNSASYQKDWGAVSSAPSKKCDASACNSSELAKFDLWQWYKNLAAILPGGDAAIFEAAAETGTNKRQLGVMISWRENERVTVTGDDKFKTPLVVSSTGTAAVSCPTGKLCHLQYIQLGARCTRWPLGGSDVMYCPAGRTDL